MKITIEQQEKGQKLHQELVQKAWESITFKEQLVSNPEATIAEVLGVETKGNSNIVVEDQTDSDIIYLNIPRKININDIELTEEQLEAVSGGGWNPIIELGRLVGYGFALIENQVEKDTLYY
ncbi:hypothetical protein PG911_00600 [Tenacibaculum ovolyticum]|uniref:hypothetical protein n=1 Tax=Tenacibaculum ovolyticum TaxID=104270 RepID=UPI0022F3C221|nr:hypothetical protein [Tenacibaculum ovolyticum]WBX76791.1 hypothetical protein PG911_00600 [Tenacibaculum ovolyticum]